MKKDELGESLDKILTWDIQGKKEPLIFKDPMKTAILKWHKEHLAKDRQQLIHDCFEIIKEVNQKLFMYETLMGKIEGDDVAKQFIEYQELEPERTKFANWLETQREILKTMEKNL